MNRRRSRRQMRELDAELLADTDFMLELSTSRKQPNRQLIDLIQPKREQLHQKQPQRQLLELLQGEDDASQQRLDQFKASLPLQTKLLWYPSAGCDFRDLLRFTIKHEQVNVGVQELPDLFVHTDYIPPFTNYEPGWIIDDGRTHITLENTAKLTWNSPIFLQCIQAI